MFLNEINSGLNSETLSTLYLHFQKDFDVVCHKKLLEKLFFTIFPGGVYALIERYLTIRRQSVRVEGFLSEEGTVLSVVPHELVLGPLFSLFL